MPALVRGFLVACLFVFAQFTAVSAQTDEQLAEMARTAAILEQSPVLNVGDTPIDVAPATGQFFWIEPDATGLYSLSIDGPGAIRMSTFPNASGRFDGETSERVIVEAANAYGGPQIGPFLLAQGWPYLLSINATGPATLTLTQLETFGAPIPTPDKDSLLGTGDYLIAHAGDLRLQITDPDSPARVETWAEPRAEFRSDVDGSGITRFIAPFDPDKDTRLNLRAKIPEGQPDPLTLIRIAPFGVPLDETEPNRSAPNLLDVDRPFQGLLLLGNDRDRMQFTLPAARDLTLGVATDALWADYAVVLEQKIDGQNVPVLRRTSVRGALPPTPVHLEAGEYILELAGDNPNDGAIGYTLTFAPTNAADAGREAEPNDHITAATALSEAGTLRGAVASDDIDFVSFAVEAPNRLWRVFALNAERLILTGPTGVITDVSAVDGRAIADALALAPGDYAVEIRGNADYAFRVLDLGERPATHEAEPNNTPVNAQLLRFGEAFTGAFSGSEDVDLFQFRLGAETPVEISITPAGDGPMDAQLSLGNARWGQNRDFVAGGGPYHFQGKLPAGDWFIQLRARSNLTRGTYRVSVDRTPEVSGMRPDDTPATAQLVPLDGDVTGQVGAFDAEDHFLVRLPATSRAAFITCDGAGWSLWPWSGGRKIESPRSNMSITDPTADNGGAVRIVVTGDKQDRDYACGVRFPPGPDALPTATAASAAEEITLRSGAHLSGTLTAETSRQFIAFDLSERAYGVVACFDGNGDALAARGLRPRDLTLLDHAAIAPFVAFRAGPASGVEMRASLAEGEEAAWRCAMLGMDDLPRLADLGDLAALTTPPDAAPALPEGSPGLLGTAPSLDALLALVPPATLPSGDLPLAITFDTPPPVAAYAQAGQRLSVSAKLINSSDAAMTFTVSGDAAGQGWDVMTSPDTLELGPGATGSAMLELTAPPWLSPVVPPSVTLTATSGSRFATGVLGIDVATDAPTQGALVYFDAPQALRGGLNLLHYGLGARLVEAEGKEVSARDADGRAHLHDGIAPHAGVRDIARDLTFALPGPAEVAGAMIHLRSTANPLNFPTVYEVYVSDDGISWTRGATGELHRAMTPQYAIFAAPLGASYVRFRFPNCPTDRCNRVALQELQAIGVPGTHPDGWPAVNAADPDLGGHVIYSTLNQGGNWNISLLQADADARNAGWQTRNENYRAVIGFHQNRAALVERVVWIGNPIDTARPDTAIVEASLTGPAGPWVQIGALVPPAIGEERSELRLDTPAWARYVRVSFLLPSDTKPSGPDALEIIEAPGASVVGLWEDDRPEAAFEAANGAGAVVAVAPSGGADRDSAVELQQGGGVTSSVLLERNEDWWRLTVPDGPVQEVHVDFQTVPLEVAVELMGADGALLPLEKTEMDTSTRMTTLVGPGQYHLRVYEPPRSVVIAWDTSGSVASYIPRTLAAVRLWSESLVPGRDVLQLLPFANEPAFILDDWAETPEDVAPALRDLVTTGSSSAEPALSYAADALARRDGARGVVIITDAESGPDLSLWPNLLRARPRVVALSIDSDSRQNAAIMMDWANLNRGRFQRVVGAVGLADGLDMAAALFRAPKSYDMTLTLLPYEEPAGEATITITLAELDEGAAPAPSGAVEVILDASGSMLQRLDGQRRITVAHEALSRLVTDTLPDGIPFAFRAFGLEADACLSELRTPLGPLDRSAARRAILDVPAINNARTAIADSLTAAASDLADAGEPRVIVLVTDGEETCDGDPQAAIAAIRASGFDVRVNIVGFAIDDAALAATFADWARAGGGTYFEARDSAALDAAVDRALTPAFALQRRYVDGNVEALGTLVPGEMLTVPAGQIEILPESIAAGDGLTRRLAPGDNLQLIYDPVSGLSAN
ncbi:VWA domain-containing protein [Loktanella sp. Alg231-35]|uniref:VWA domain-containing protein n=1 Tax=Loktanella sp. Alg231-35 TaxID=1922220 RepID=UPI00131EDD68|nr:VWA domain-containing protein [Loktanella sp. Alg231-35]